MKKLDQLTFTRFIAAFMVIVFHGGVGVFPFTFFPLVPLISSGQTAVSYFFVLSGFVMALAYYNPEKRLDLWSYLSARFSRIYPVYILAFVFTALFYVNIMAKMKWDKIWANIFLYQAWVPRYSQSFNMAAWSLSVEVFFYLVFPLFAVLLTRIPTRWVVRLSIIFWVFSQVIHSVLYTLWMPDQKDLLDYFPLFHLSTFLLGVAGGIWYRDEAPRLTVKKKTNLVWLFVGLLLVSLALMGRRRIPGLFEHISLDSGLLAPFFLVIILTLSADTSRLSRWFSSPLLVLLGDASYALYILHVPVRWWLERIVASINLNISFATLYYFYVPLMLALSVAVFKWIERPSRDWLRHNMDKLPLMLVDILLLAAAVWAGFAIRLGAGQESFEHAQLFAFRMAVPVYFLGLVLFRTYNLEKFPWKRVGLASLAGGLVLAAMLYLAWVSGWIEGFPRLVIILNMMLTFLLALSARMLFQLAKARLLLAGKQA